jgi:hypothetical protein
MTTTVCVASNSAMPDQIAATGNHFTGDAADTSFFMAAIVRARDATHERRAANGGFRAGNDLAGAGAAPHHGGMRPPLLLTAFAALAFACCGALAQPGTPSAANPDPAAVAAAMAAVDAPSYADDKLRIPAGYRQWVYLTTGFDMSYSANSRPGHHMFDNVFVNPGSYRQFLQTGTWPDKTTIVVEVRGAQSKGSINQAGQFQDGDMMGLEVHVKDEARFPGKWAFFGFDDGERTATMVPRDVDCYSCHEKHGAVDTTFVQFYPTLLPVAKTRGTLAASYLAETAAH